MFRFGLVRVAGWLLCYMFFFFKQKTAYEVRISDWSSDVCSSDLLRLPHELAGRAVLETRHGTGGVDLVLQASGGIVEPIATPALGILDHPQPVGIVVDMARRALHAVAGQRHAVQAAAFVEVGRLAEHAGRRRGHACVRVVADWVLRYVHPRSQ